LDFYAVRAINKLKRMFFLAGERRSAPLQDSAPLYGLTGGATRESAPVRFSCRRKAPALILALLLDDVNLAALDGF
jgi:uncharacterized protein